MWLQYRVYKIWHKTCDCNTGCTKFDTRCVIATQGVQNLTQDVWLQYRVYKIWHFCGPIIFFFSWVSFCNSEDETFGPKHVELVWNWYLFVRHYSSVWGGGVLLFCWHDSCFLPMQTSRGLTCVRGSRCGRRGGADRAVDTLRPPILFFPPWFWDVRPLVLACLSLVPSCRMEQRDYCWADFRRSSYLWLLLNFVEKIVVWLKWDKH